MNKKQDLSHWNIAPIRQKNEEIKEKFITLQNYCEDLYRIKYPADFYLKTLSLVNNKPEYVEKLDHDTTSVFLGIFLKAVLQITERKFGEDWEIICATGDLEYDKTDEKLHLVSIADVPNKYTDEFTAIAEENKDKKCLFLYISDKEEKEVSQGTHGNITVKCFSPDDTIEDIFACLFNGLFPPIQCKVNLNLNNVTVLKNYLVKAYLEDPEGIGFYEGIGFPEDIDLSELISTYFDEYQTQDLNYFEGYISASLCLLYLIEEMLREIKDGKCPKDMDEYVTSIFFLKLMGNFNNGQRETAVDNNIPNVFDDDFVLQASFLEEAPTQRIAEFCPSRQSKIFYAAWNRFCVLFCGLAERNNLLFIPSKLKYRVLDPLDHCLNKYLGKYHYDTYMCWLIVDFFILSEFKLEGYERIVRKFEREMKAIETEKKNKLTWKEQIIEKLNYNDNDRESIENILGCFKDKERGLKVAVNSLFARKVVR
jgi:hypothetical protein